MASFASRVPLRELGFACALLLMAGISAWMSGRSMLLPELFRPGLAALEAGWSALRGGASYLQDLNHLKQENARLQREVDDLESQASRQAETASEVVRLRALLSMQATLPEHGRFARVIGRSPDNWHARIYLDKGSADGVQVDAVAMAPLGVVGRVIRVGAHTAEVALLTDPGDEVSCLDQRSRSPGVVSGEGESSLEMHYLQQQVDFRIGDALITSGYGGVYPKGLPLGTVARVSRQANSIIPRVAVVPDADLDRVEDVMVLDALPGVLP